MADGAVLRKYPDAHSLNYVFFTQPVESQQQAFDSKHISKTAKNIPDYDAMLQRQEVIKKEYEKELLELSLLIIEWYKTLVKFSSHVFEAEHWLRKSKANA